MLSVPFVVPSEENLLLYLFCNLFRDAFSIAHCMETNGGVTSKLEPMWRKVVIFIVVYHYVVLLYGRQHINLQINKPVLLY
jgi:hypothetical protein